MKPSEFWTRVLALPEQARRAEQDASDLRIAADALCEWAKLATDIHRKVIVLADDGDMDTASAWLDELGHRPDPNAHVVVVSEPSAQEPPKPARKQRSDAGKPRVRKTDSAGAPAEDDGGPPANPADVKARDAAKVRFAGFIREAVSSAGEPMTMGGLVVRTGLDEDDVRSGLKLLSLVSWRMQREGDSQPVEVWGTYKQLGDAVHAFDVDRTKPIDALAMAFGVSIPTISIALREAP